MARFRRVRAAAKAALPRPLPPRRVVVAGAAAGATPVAAPVAAPPSSTTRAPPPIPPTGLPQGWTQDQWDHFGWQYVDAMTK